MSVPKFSGERDAFQLWWTKFRAFATVKKFVLALASGGESDMPATESEALDTMMADGKRMSQAKECNAVGMAFLLMAFEKEADVGLAYKTMMNDWPGGRCYMVVELLLKKYQPSDTMTLVEVNQMLDVKMSSNENPATLFEQVSKIENWYNTPTRKLDEQQLIAVVLKAAAESYQSVLMTVQLTKGNGLTMDDLEDAMNKMWCASNRNKKGSSSEVALSAVGGRKCFNCNQKGHIAKDCPLKKSSGGSGGIQGKFNGKCHTCGKTGHKATDCWANEANKDKRPAWYKPGETSAAAIGGGDNNEVKVEAMLCQLTFPSNFKMLFDKNVWVCDTAATCHSTRHG